MRIGIDAHAVGSGLGGNESYITGLLDALGRIESHHEFVAYFASEGAASSWRGRYDNIVVRQFRTHSRLARLLMELPARAARDRVDVLHVQAVAPPVGLVPIVATVHDICYEFFPEYFERSEALQLRAAIRMTAHRARRIITVSETTKRDIIDVYGIPPAKIDVAYNGVDHGRFRPSGDGSGVLVRYGIRSPYVLAVGNLQPRKNLGRLIDAFAMLRRSRPELPHRLVLVGKAAFRHSETHERVRERGLEDRVIFTGYVPNEDLPALYGNAAVFAYPSLYEGFGLPVAEAMACGAPVLTSDRASLPEVAGDGAVLVDPENTSSIQEGLLRILADPALAGTLAARSTQRAQTFTWESAARTTLACFETAVGEKR